VSRPSRSPSDGEGTAHQKSVARILDTAHQAWQALTELQATDHINPEGVFASAAGEQNPQKRAHDWVMGYRNLIGNKTYWIQAKDLWQDPITDERGRAYQATVPVEDVIHIDGNLAIDAVETETEKITLETLHHRWALRDVTVVRQEQSTWGSGETIREQRRVWLPPKAIMLLFDRLEDLRSTIGLGADVEPPGFSAEKVLDPTEGLREPHSEQEGAE